VVVVVSVIVDVAVVVVLAAIHQQKNIYVNKAEL